MKLQVFMLLIILLITVDQSTQNWYGRRDPKNDVKEERKRRTQSFIDCIRLHLFGENYNMHVINTFLSHRWNLMNVTFNIEYWDSLHFRSPDYSHSLSCLLQGHIPLYRPHQPTSNGSTSIENPYSILFFSQDNGNLSSNILPHLMSSYAYAYRINQLINQSINQLINQSMKI